MGFETKSYPFIPARHFTNVSSRTVRVIVIHDMEAPEGPTTAENVAKWWNGPNSSRSSAHYCHDTDSTVQCVWDTDVAWAAPGCNHDGIQQELAGYARQSRAEWLDDASMAVMRQASYTTAELCIKYNIPPVHLTDAELRAGKKGLIGHVQASNVYKKSSHWDPGPNFPWDVYLKMVQDNMRLILKGDMDNPDDDDKPDFNVAIITMAESDIDLGMALALRERHDLINLTFPHEGITVGGVVLVGAAASQAKHWYRKRNIPYVSLTGEDRYETAEAVVASILVGRRGGKIAKLPH